MQVTTRFLKLETLLDDSVGQKVELQIERGGKSLTVNLVVRYFLGSIYPLLKSTQIALIIYLTLSLEDNTSHLL